MKSNNIDKLFQDKLKDVKVPPPEGAWEDIAEKLPNKKKNRVIMLWWSAAAVLLVLIASGVFYWSFSEPVNRNTKFVETSNKSSEISIKENQEHTIATEGKVVEDTDSTILKDTSKEQKYKNDSKLNPSKNKALADRSHQDKTIAIDENKEGKSSSITTDTQDLTENKKDKSEQKQKDKERLFAKQDAPINEGNAKDKEKDREFITEQITQTKSLEIAEEKEKQEAKSLVDNNNLLATEEETSKKAEGKQQGKWSVGPQVAPVYYNSLTGGSSLDTQFDNSEKEGEINMSMGLQVAYQLNDSWQVRSGINRVSVGYATNNVQVGYSDPNFAVANINYKNVPDGDIVVTAFSNNNLSNLQASQQGNKIEVMYIEGNTQLKQSMTYLEVPIEIERKLIQTDFEWSIIGGVSSLFLTGNDVYVANKDYTSNIGSANNLEKTSFTTNIGMGFGYNFTKNIHFQLEPMFKYQMNAYTNSVDFKPYIFGVYTGVSWRLD